MNPSLPHEERPTIIVQYASAPTELDERIKFRVTHNLFAGHDIWSRSTRRQIDTLVNEYTKKINDLVSEHKSCAATYDRELKRVLHIFGTNLRDQLLDDKATNWLSNFWNSNAVLVLGDSYAANFPWELMRLDAEDSSLPLSSCMVVTRVCDQESTDPFTRRHIDLAKCSGVYTQGACWNSRSSNALDICGLSEVATIEQFIQIVSSSEGIAVVAKTKRENNDESLQLSDNEVYSPNAAVAYPLPIRSVVFLFSCEAGAGEIARQIVRISKSTVIASKYLLPQRSAHKLARLTVRELSSLATTTELSTFWHNVICPKNRLADLFSVYGDWRGLLLPKGESNAVVS